MAKKLALNGVEGVLITDVLKDGAAKKAGIESYDVLISINNVKVNSVSQLHDQIIKFSPGDEIICEVKRNGKIKILKLN